MQNRQTNHYRIIAAVVAALVFVAVLVISLNSASCARQVKRWTTDYGRGVDRTVTLVSATGQEVQRWEGIIDVEFGESDGKADLLFFDEDGNECGRTVVMVGGGSLVVEDVQ